MTSPPLPEQIQQVLYNLLDNAVKFSSDNSSITLETTVNHGKVFVSVKDHGTGIPKESLSRIWDRFYKIDVSRGKDRKGTGLGLAIVKEIINAHKQKKEDRGVIISTAELEKYFGKEVTPAKMKEQIMSLHALISSS